MRNQASPPPIAFVTYQNPPYLGDSEALLAEPLKERGVSLELAAWDDKQVPWERYAAIILRSTWDYHQHVNEFNKWLKHLEDVQARVFNPLPMLRWNMDKTYLEQLSKADVPILPTEWLPRGAFASLEKTLARMAWPQAIVKPTIGAGGDDTWLVTLDEAEKDQARFEDLLTRSGVMVQLFAPQILQGEWSFFYFNGVYSHAVLKFPAPGQFLVHEHRGGSAHGVQPPAALIRQASAILRLACKLNKAVPLYARIDGFVTTGQLVLMELELIEPALYLEYADDYAVERAADAIASVV